MKKTEFNQFNIYDISEAHYQLGKIYLFGNKYCKRDAKLGIKHIEAARLDKGFVALLNFYKAFGDKYIKSIRKCIGMIVDVDIRQKLIVECGFAIPPVVDTSEILRKLHATPVIQNLKPAITVEDSEEAETDEETDQEELITEEEVLRNTQAIAEEFDSSLLDSMGDEEYTSSIDDADVELAGVDGDQPLNFMEEDEFDIPDDDLMFEPDF